VGLRVLHGDSIFLNIPKEKKQKSEIVSGLYVHVEESTHTFYLSIHLVYFVLFECGRECWHLFEKKRKRTDFFLLDRTRERVFES
jgi:hypothetical protein